MHQTLKLKGGGQRKLVELYADGGVDATENMFYPIEFNVKEEIRNDAKPYR